MPLLLTVITTVSSKPQLRDQGYALFKTFHTNAPAADTPFSTSLATIQGAGLKSVGEALVQDLAKLA